MSDRWPPLQSMHHDRLDAQRCLPLYCYCRYPKYSSRVLLNIQSTVWFNQLQVLFRKFRWFVIFIQCTLHWKISCVPLELDTQHVFTFSLPFEPHETVSLHPSSKSFHRFFILKCIFFYRFSQAEAVTRQQSVAPMTLEQLILWATFSCTLAAR